MPEIETKCLKMITFTADKMEIVLRDKQAFVKEVGYQLEKDWPLAAYAQFFSYKINQFGTYLGSEK